MKNIVKVVAKVMMVIIISLILLDRFSVLFRQGQSNQGNNFRGFDEDSFDVLVLGSSHAQYSFNPSIYYHETGHYAYVLGSACQALPVSYEYLKEALETQSPEVVFVEVFTMLPDVAVCRTDGVTKLAGDEMTGLQRYNAIWHIDNKRENLLEYWFDIIMTHSDWATMDIEQFLPAENKVVDVLMGHVTQMPDNYNRWEVEQYTHMNTGYLKGKDIEYLLKIKQLCDDNDIQLVLYKAPYMYNQSGYDALEEIWKLAEENDIEYVNGFDHLEEMNFYLGQDGDAWHNNVWGARKMTEFLAKYSLENQLVKEHQYNELLENSLQTGIEYTKPMIIQKTIDPYLLLELAEKYDCTVAIHYNGNKTSVIGEVENNLLQNVGFNHDFSKEKNKDYYAIAVHQQEVSSSQSEANYEHNGHVLKVNKEGIFLDDYQFYTESQMTIVVFGNDFSWSETMNIDYSYYFWKNGYVW